MSDEYGSAPPPAKDEKEAKESEEGDRSDDPELARLGPDYRRDPVDGGLVYVDPTTKQEFVLNADKTDWVPKNTEG